MDQPTPNPGERLTEGVAKIVDGVASDLHATLMNVAFGTGQAVQPAHLTNENSNQLEAGLSDLVGGTLEALQQQLSGGNSLDAMRAQLTGQDHEQGQEHGREQGR